VLQYLSEAYGDLPIYVQENGKSNMISVFLNVLVQLYLDKITEMFTVITTSSLSFDDSSCLVFLFSGNVSNDTLDDTGRIEYLKTYMGSTLKALRLVIDSLVQEKSPSCLY
jgi:hypothetical protein